MSVKVSIIIPVYNVESYLRKCLDSVIHQTLRDIEIICVNDKSPDHSLEILEEYAATDSRIVIINNEINMGLSGARNEGIKRAMGQYVYFLDSDDWVTEDAMETLYLAAESEQVEGVLFDSKMEFEGESSEPTDLYMAKNTYDGVYEGSRFLAEMRKNDDIREPVWLQFWRRDFIINNNLMFYEGILHEDLLFTFTALMVAERVVCINKQLHFYRIRQNAITSSGISVRHISGLVKTYAEIMGFWRGKEYNPEIEETISHYLDRISWKINRYHDTFHDEKGVYNDLQNGLERHIYKIVLEPQHREKLYW